MKLENGANKSINIQLKILKKILLNNPRIRIILETLDDIGMSDYYLAAGCISQTVFNYYHGFKYDFGINDYDIVYFDKDTSYEMENYYIELISKRLEGVNVKLDIKNQARVHLWYEEKFGHTLEANKSVEDAIRKWGTTITCIGVKMQSGKLITYAPYGLNDLFEMKIRPNKSDFIKKDYDIKTKKWKDKWPLINVIPWDN